MVYIAKKNEKWLLRVEVHISVCRSFKCDYLNILMRLSLITVNWEMFCWPADVHFAHAYLSHPHAGLPPWFALSCFATLF